MFIVTDSFRFLRLQFLKRLENWLGVKAGQTNNETNAIRQIEWKLKLSRYLGYFVLLYLLRGNFKNLRSTKLSQNAINFKLFSHFGYHNILKIMSQFYYFQVTLISRYVTWFFIPKWQFCWRYTHSSNQRMPFLWSHLLFLSSIQVSPT